jgi:endonuclease/exonuclease/phosphatase (EEP) superfamily protein YafD
MVPTGLWLLEIAAPFRLQLALVGAVLMIALLAVKRRHAGGICLLCSLVLSSHLIPYYSDMPQPDSDRPQLSLLSWNTWRDVNSGAEMRMALQKFQPQLAFFQEVTLEEEAGFLAEGYVKNYVGDFLVLMKPEVVVVVEPHFPEWTDTPSVFMTIRFEGQFVDIYSLHPRSPMSVRRLRHRNQFFKQLESKINASVHASIVIGDLNTTPTDPAFKSLLTSANLRNSMIGFGWQTSWPYDNIILSALRIPIDHCLSSATLKVVDRKLGDAHPSNHKPLFVRVQSVEQN